MDIVPGPYVIITWVISQENFQGVRSAQDHLLRTLKWFLPSTCKTWGAQTRPIDR